MPGNRDMIERLFEEGKIDVERSALFDTAPPPMPADFEFSRVEGMMLGLAISDALGNTSEGMTPNQRRSWHGEIRDYLMNWHAANRPTGLPSDDTQLAFWALEQMIADREFIPERVAKRFTQGRIFGLGSSVAQFLRNYQAGKPWHESGPKSSGNGALMRIAPILIPHLRSPSSDLWTDTVLCAMITHNDSGSISACLAFVNMLWHLLQMKSLPEPHWWLDTYVKVARDLEVDETYQPRGGAFVGYRGPIWRFVEEKVAEAYEKGQSILEACNAWYSGAFLLETVPCVIYILMKHGQHLEEAVVRAVNDTRDNDTIAAIVGAAVGALHGREGIPERWIRNLSGRTSSSDDGRVFELLDKAKRLWS